MIENVGNRQMAKIMESGGFEYGNRREGLYSHGSMTERLLQFVEGM